MKYIIFLALLPIILSSNITYNLSWIQCRYISLAIDSIEFKSSEYKIGLGIIQKYLNVNWDELYDHEKYNIKNNINLCLLHDISTNKSLFSNIIVFCIMIYVIYITYLALV